MCGRLAVDPLHGKRSVIDPLFTTSQLQMSVGALGPFRADLVHQAPVVPLPDLQPEAFFTNRSHREHHMSVRVLSLPLGAVVDCNICNHSPLDELLLHE